MANHLDLEEQEQLDQLKHFWKQYGNLITGILILVLGTFAAWNGYQFWQQKQSTQAAAMFDEVEKVVRSGDVAQAERAFEHEKSQQVRYALAQNLNVLKQRLARVRKLDELVRLLEARLLVIRNSLGLVQDEVYTFTDVASISGLVDNLLNNLSVSDEFRVAFEDVLNTETGATEAANWETQLLNAADETMAVPSEAESFKAPPRSRERA